MAKKRGFCEKQYVPFNQQVALSGFGSSGTPLMSVIDALDGVFGLESVVKFKDQGYWLAFGNMIMDWMFRAHQNLGS